MAELQHTPTPWSVNNWTQRSKSVIGIGAIGTPLIAEVLDRDVSINQHKANAELIVRAVNSHKALLAALIGFTAMAENENIRLGPDSNSATMSQWKATIREARAAINGAGK